jgi:hypothetical protein
MLIGRRGVVTPSPKLRTLKPLLSMLKSRCKTLSFSSAFRILELPRRHLLGSS